MKKFTLFLFLLFSALAGCNKDPDYLPDQDLKDDVKITSESWSDYSPEQLTLIYNEGINEFAFAVAKALKDEDFRLALKNEALIKIDGDYDILWKAFKNKEIKNEKIIKTVAKNLKKNISLDNKIKETEMFGSLFKQLQISVPVNIDKWDAQSYVPVVAFRQATSTGFCDNLVTYDLNGNKGELDSEKCPSVPVVVIDLNERSDSEGEILPVYIKNNSKKLISKVNGKLALQALIPQAPVALYGSVPMPTSITGQFINNYILLSWDLQIMEQGEYYIEVEKEIGGYFSLIDSKYTYGGYDSYFDFNDTFEPGRTYLYRLRTKFIDIYGTEEYSSYSQIIQVSVQAPGLPAPTNVKASIVGPNNIDLKWDYPTTANITGFKIRRRRPLRGETFDNDIPSIVSYSQREFTDIGTKVLGDQYEYEVRAYNSSGESIPDHDVTYNPYRSSEEFLYLTKIKFFNINEFEKWNLGTPEIEVTVAHGDYDGDTQPSVITREERITPAPIPLDGRDYETDPICEYGYSYNPFQGQYWDSFFYKQVVNFNFVEYDAPGWFTGWKDLTFKVSIPIKIMKVEIKVEAGATIAFHIKNTSVSIGEHYVKFWDPKEKSVMVDDDILVTYSTEYPNWPTEQ